MGSGFTWSFVAFLICLFVFGGVALLFVWKMYTSPRAHDQHIVQFDTLQNEEEYGM